MISISSLFILSSILTIGLSTTDQFNKYKVYSLIPFNHEQVNVLQYMNEFSMEYDFWTSIAIDKETDVMVPPHKLLEFLETMNVMNISYKLNVRNVQSLIQKERPKKLPSKKFNWTSYNTYSQIYEWLDEQLKLYSNILTNYVIGTSFEGRPIRAIKLSYKKENPIIFIEANIHAREWITSATATWILNELLTSNNSDIRYIAENFDWVIVPIVNVDGYVYSHTKNRFWRKTRQQHGVICNGVDPNRNFDFHWNSVGASSFPCSIKYAGPKPFSEPETKNLDVFFQQFSNRTKLYLAFHSYGQQLLYPYCSTKVSARNSDILEKIGIKTAEAISLRYGTKYDIGSFSSVLYEASGCSIDWIYDKYQIELVYLFEFRDKKYGFLLPSNKIIPNSLEVMDGLIAMIKESRALNKI